MEKETDRWAGRLYQAMAAAGFSVKGFAYRMGVHRTTIWRIERGEIAPSEEWSARAETLLAVDEPIAA